MPITENNFTAEEFDAAMTANPALVDLVVGFATDANRKQHPLVSKLEPAFAGPVTSKFAQGIEKDVLELTGIPKKDANEKYYDYQRRAIGEKLGTVKQLQDEIALLKDKSNPSAADKARITQLENALTEKENTWKEKYSGAEKQLHELRVRSTVTGDLAQLRARYKAGLPESLVKLAEDTAIASIISKAKFQEDGTLTFLKDNGEVELNPSTYKPEGALGILEVRLKDLLDEGKKQEGAGTKPGDATGTVEKGKFVIRPASITTKAKLTEYLLQLGYTDDMPEFTKIMQEHGAALPLK